MKVIFLDAVGTLFGVKESVGHVYGAIARDFGVNLAPEDLNQAFFATFRSATPLAFPGETPQTIPEKEYQWWRAIAQETFHRAGGLEQFSDFDEFFRHLYHHFSTADPWFLYPDVRPTLDHWHQQGIPLGILSNFDSRLYPVLNALDLTDYFTSFTLSSAVSAAKPDPRIFVAALAQHSLTPSDAHHACHIGDSLKEDYQGAQAAGLKAIWVKR